MIRRVLVLMLLAGPAYAQQDGTDMQPFPEAQICLPLGGGTMTGDITMSGVDTQIIFAVDNDAVTPSITLEPGTGWYAAADGTAVLAINSTAVFTCLTAGCSASGNASLSSRTGATSPLSAGSAATQYFAVASAGVVSLDNSAPLNFSSAVAGIHGVFGTGGLCLTNGNNSCLGSIGALTSRLSSDPSGITSAVLANTTLSVTLTASSTYRLTAHLMYNDSTAADGVQFDFGGGAATMTDIRADCVIGESGQVAQDTVTEVIALSTNVAKAALVGTGAAFAHCEGTLTVNGAGTFIVRVAQSSHSTGTLTLRRGSYIRLEYMP